MESPRLCWQHGESPLCANPLTTDQTVLPLELLKKLSLSLPLLLCLPPSLSLPLSVSQGVPFPQNEANAMDVVVQFAMHKLGFQVGDIIVYAWSIGGFTGTDAGPCYREEVTS